MKVFVTRTPPAVDSVTVVPAHAPNASLPEDGALLTYAIGGALCSVAGMVMVVLETAVDASGKDRVQGVGA